MIITRRRALILLAPALLLPHRRLLSATLPLSFSVASGVTGFPGQSGNPVGFAAAPGYPGSLTSMSIGSIASGQTYNYKLFDNGTSPINISATGVTFNGCYFGASTSVSTSQAHTTWSGGNNVCNFCTFAPSPSVVGGSFPPQAPGYSTWPTGSTLTLSDTICNNYGMVGSGGNAPPSGGLIFNSCDMWGIGQGNVFSKSNSSNPLTFSNCWMHDPPVTYDGNHTDGVGDVQSQSSDYVENLTISGCTLAIICNSNDVAFQPNSPSQWLFNNNIINGNYITSTASYVVQSGMNRTTSTPTNNQFKNNTFSPYLTAEFGLLYENDTSIFSANGNVWSGNKILPGTYPQVGTVTSSTPYLWPNATANASDFTG